MWRLLLTLLLSALPWLVTPSPARAFSLSPAIIEERGDPGSTIFGEVELKNTDAFPQTLYPSIRKFLPKGEEGQQTFLPESDVSGIPSWIYLATSKVTLEPLSSARIAFEIRVPTLATPGGHYAAIFWSNSQPMRTGVGVTTASRIGSLIFFTVNGALEEKARMTDFSVQNSTGLEGLPVTFRVRFENTGTTHIKPQGVIRITNIFGRSVAQLPVNPDELRLLPGQSRTLKSDWLKKDAPFFAVGPFVASLTVTEPVTELVFSSSVRFWLFPWKSISVFVLVLMSLIAGLVSLNRARRRV